MTEAKKFLGFRFLGYALGFALFYAPIALFQKALIGIFKIGGRADIHGSCFRMAIQSVFTGKGLNVVSTTGVIVSLLMVSAFLLGPVFCGKLCAAGGISECLSRIIPGKIQIRWQKYIDPTPIRYGSFVGFLFSSFAGASVLCAYCNYSLYEKLVSGVINRDLAVLSSASIIVGFVWLILLGAFAKGGRGFCSYFCPIGAAQSLLHSIGSKLPFTVKLKFSKAKCGNCSLCVKDCPMGALKSGENELIYNIHNCIACNQCVHTCPKKAITYGRGKAGWNVKSGDVPADSGIGASGSPA